MGKAIPFHKVTAEKALSLLCRGEAGRGLQVAGNLDLSGKGPLNLPEGLVADSLNLEGAKWLTRLPGGMRVRRLRVAGCPNLRTVPADLECQILEGSESGLRMIPEGLRVGFRLDLTRCAELVGIGGGLTATSVVLTDCTALEALPEGLNLSYLDVSGCGALERWPERGTLSIGRLNMSNCLMLKGPPAWMGRISQLSMSGCVGVRELSAETEVTSWIDVGGTQLKGLPAGCAGAAVRWRGVFIDRRIAFEPEAITVGEIVGEKNAEIRRVMLERIGYARFLEEAKAEELDRDRDAGGERRLVRVPLEGDEDLVCVAVQCPSTRRQYVLRVPPNMRTCRQAVAWVAGFNDPDAYQLVVET